MVPSGRDALDCVLVDRRLDTAAVKRLATEVVLADSRSVDGRQKARVDPGAKASGYGTDEDLLCSTETADMPDTGSGLETLFAGLGGIAAKPVDSGPSGAIQTRSCCNGSDPPRQNRNPFAMAIHEAVVVLL